MPVLDWARTDLLHANPNGTSNLYFSIPQFAYFDIYLLKRKGAKDDWARFQALGPDGQPNGRDILKEVEVLKQTMTPEKDHELVENIVIKTQGFVSGNFKEGDEHPIALFRQLLALYEGIDRTQLRENMRYFLEAIMPVCDECDMYMCVHPDDPPFQILGLPRIVTCDEDIHWFLKAVDNPHNGLTFCAGSLSAGAQNQVVDLARKYASRTAFVHLRSCHVFPNGDFTEASHLGGRADLIELARIFEQEEQRRATLPNISRLPMRVDHGMTMLGDETKGYNAGYSVYHCDAFDRSNPKPHRRASDQTGCTEPGQQLKRIQSGSCGRTHAETSWPWRDSESTAESFAGRHFDQGSFVYFRIAGRSCTDIQRYGCADGICKAESEACNFEQIFPVERNDQCHYARSESGTGDHVFGQADRAGCISDDGPGENKSNYGFRADRNRETRKPRKESDHYYIANCAYVF